MKIINLVENEEGSSGCQAAHGLSFYVETKLHKFLFDTGPGDILLTNAQKLGIDLSKVDTVILSHGHYDHSGGILPFTKVNSSAKIYMQKNACGEYFAFDGPEKGYRYIGIDKQINTLPNLCLLQGDSKIDQELEVFTVQDRAYPLPSTNKRLKQLSGENYIQDEFKHEQNLILTTEGKRILFSGCSHNGILNILQSMENKFGKDCLPELVVGGFHLMKRSDYSQAESGEIEEIARKLTSCNIHFATCHCTGLEVFNQMKKIMGDQLTYVYSGDQLF